MPAYLLEAYVVLLGLVILMMEAFGPAERKHYLGWAAIGGLIFGFVLLFFAANAAHGNQPAAPADWPMMQRFYAFDRAAIFYKGLAMICTIVVLFLSLDYRKVLEQFTENPGSEDGTGEYYALPIFACAGMMWMASAKDLVSVFVALELVTRTGPLLASFDRDSLCQILDNLLDNAEKYSRGAPGRSVIVTVHEAAGAWVAFGRHLIAGPFLSGVEGQAFPFILTWMGLSLDLFFGVLIGGLLGVWLYGVLDGFRLGRRVDAALAAGGRP